jgi:putative Holliday junction resolvase
MSSANFFAFHLLTFCFFRPLLCHGGMNITPRALGVDPGSVRIGLALSDELGYMAHPLKTLKAGAESPAEIAGVAADKGSRVIVIGLPRNMNGTYGPAAEKSRALADAITPLTPARVILWDERLTTAAATRRLQEAGRNSREQRSVIDQAAAVQILQDWLDSNAP